MKKIIDKIIDFYKKNKSKLEIIFFIIIPVIIAIVGGTLGYANKGYLGAIAGFFRSGFYFYLFLIIVNTLFLIIYKYRQFLSGILLLLVIGGFIWILIWILAWIINKLSWFFNNY